MGTDSGSTPASIDGLPRRADDPATIPDRGSDLAARHAPVNRWITRVVAASAAVLIGLPIVAAVIAWRGGWMPFGDEAAVIAQSWGTFTAHPPLLGNYTSASGITGAPQVLYHPGPLQLWLIAAPLRVFAPSTFGALIAPAAWGSACIAIFLFAVWRRGRLRFLVPTLLSLSWFVYAAGPQLLRAPYHDGGALFGMLALIGAAWAILDHDEWFWPVAVVCATLTAQAQTTYLLPVGFVVLVTVTWRLTERRRAESSEDAPQRRRSRVIATVSMALALLGWSGPLYDQTVGTGNFWALITTGSNAKAAGPGWALNRLIDMLAFPPAWLSGKPRVAGPALGESHVVWHTPGSQVVQAALFTVLLVAVFTALARARNRRLLAFGVLGLGSTAGAFVASAMMPADPASLVGHVRIWAISGFTVWTFVFIALADRTVAVARRRIESPALRRHVATVMAGVACLVSLIPAVLVVRDASPAHDFASGGYGAVRRFSTIGATYCRGSSAPVLVTQVGYLEVLTTLGVVARLQLEGCNVHVSDNLADPLPGAWFRRDGTESVTFRVSYSPTAPMGFRRVATYDPAKPSDDYRDFRSFTFLMSASAPLYLYVHTG